MAVLPLVAAALAVAPAAADAPAPQGRAVVPDTAPDRARSTADQGRERADARVTVRVHLTGRDHNGLDDLARQISDPASEQYGHFLSPEQLAERFGSSEEQSARVRGWLDSSGLRVTASNGHYLTADGAVADAERAFGTELHTYRKGERTYRAPAGDVTVPAHLADDVLSVTGLNTAPSRVRPGRPTPRDILPGPGNAFVNSPPFSDHFGSTQATGTPPAYGSVRPYVIQGFNGTQLRSAYGAATTGLTGRGTTVAVVDAYDSPTIGDDTARYAAEHGDAPYGRNQLLRYDPAPRRTSTRTAATPPAGTASRPSTSKRCTPSPPTRTSPTSARPPATTRTSSTPWTASSTSTSATSSPTPGANRRAPPTRPSTGSTSTCSSAAPSPASASTSPAATTATNWRTPAPSRPTCPPPCPGPRRSAAPRSRWTPRTGIASRRAGAR